METKTYKPIESPRRIHEMPGEVLLSHNLAREAIPHLIRSAALEPTCWRHFANLGTAYRQTAQYAEAREALLRASRLAPDSWEVFHSWGQLLEEEGRFSNALEARVKAWELCGKKKQDVAMGLASSLLRQGEWQRAWPYWEAGRFMRSWSPLSDLNLWQGESLKGKRLLVLPEGGYGDIMMFGRWIPVLEREGAEVSILVWDSIIGLLKLSPQMTSVELLPLSGSLDATNYDFCISLMSIPAVLEASANEIPEPFEFEVGYAGQSEFSVGLCWSAEEAGTHRKFRSLPIEDAGRFKRPDFKVQSLVPEDGVEWMNSCPQNWVETARTINSLESVATVDTAVAHLAGCLGKPTVLLLPVFSSWQWGTAEKEMEWYDDMIMFRCETPDDWSFPVSRAIAVLTEE